MRRKTFYILTLSLITTPIFMGSFAYYGTIKKQHSILASQGFIAPAFYPNEPFLRHFEYLSTPQTPHPGWRAWQKGTFVQTGKL